MTCNLRHPMGLCHPVYIISAYPPRTWLIAALTSSNVSEHVPRTCSVTWAHRASRNEWHGGKQLETRLWGRNFIMSATFLTHGCSDLVECRTKPFLETSGYRTRPLETSRCRFRLNHHSWVALQHTAPRSNTLQHTATHCNTLQHTTICLEPAHLHWYKSKILFSSSS